MFYVRSQHAWSSFRKPLSLNTCAELSTRNRVTFSRALTIPSIASPSGSRSTNHLSLGQPKFSLRNYGRYEPDYLDPKGPQIAKYELINFRLTGYDYTVLEEFGRFLHNSAERFGLSVEDAWGLPSQHLKVTKLKPESAVVEAEYSLQVYERNIQVEDSPSPTLPLFTDIIHSSLPAGVTLRVQPHFKEYTEARYIPDFALKEVRAQLDAVGSDKKKKK